jgi:hypothetical protein
VTDTETEADVPPGIMRLDCERDRLKSGLGRLAGELSPPEQPQSMTVINTAVKKIGEPKAWRTVLFTRKANPFWPLTVCQVDKNPAATMSGQDSRRDNFRRFRLHRRRMGLILHFHLTFIRSGAPARDRWRRRAERGWCRRLRRACSALRPLRMRSSARVSMWNCSSSEASAEIWDGWARAFHPERIWERRRGKRLMPEPPLS